jgi:hypothetical protein
MKRIPAAKSDIKGLSSSMKLLIIISNVGAWTINGNELVASAAQTLYQYLTLRCRHYRFSKQTRVSFGDGRSFPVAGSPTMHQQIIESSWKAAMGVHPVDGVQVQESIPHLSLHGPVHP